MALLQQVDGRGEKCGYGAPPAESCLGCPSTDKVPRNVVGQHQDRRLAVAHEIARYDGVGGVCEVAMTIERDRSRNRLRSLFSAWRVASIITAPPSDRRARRCKRRSKNPSLLKRPGSP